MSYSDSGRERDRIPDVKALLLFSEIYGYRPTPDLLQNLLSRLNRDHFLAYVSAASALIHNNSGTAMSVETQMSLIRDLGPVSGSFQAMQFAGRGRIVVHEVQLGLLFRYALHYCKRSPTSYNFAELVLKLMLITNELFTSASGELRKENPERAFFGIEVQAAAIPNERFAHVIQRYYRLFNWFDALELSALDYLPVSADMKRLLGLSPAEYISVAFAVASHLLAIQNVASLKSNHPFFNVQHYFLTLREHDKPDIWIDKFSVDASALVAQTFEPTFTIADLAPFVATPLVYLNTGVVACPLPALFEDTLNTRLLFELQSAYESTDGLEVSRRFSRLHGQFFEQYVLQLITKMVPDNYTPYGEMPYDGPSGGRKSTDVVAVRHDGMAVFAEVTKKRFRLVESLFALNEEAVFRDLKYMVIDKAKQIHDRLEDLNRGMYSFDRPIVAVAPLVVTGQGIPGMIYLKRYIESQLEAGDILQNTTPLTYCDIEELEALALALPGGIDLYALLHEKATHEEELERVRSLKNFLYYTRPDLMHKDDPAATVFLEYEAALEHMVIPTLHAWGFPFTNEG